MNALGQNTVFNTKGYTTLIATLSGVWIGQIVFEYSNDKINWNYISSASVNGSNTITVTDYNYVRARVNLYTAGEIEIVGKLIVSAGADSDSQAENVQDIETELNNLNTKVGSTTDAAVVTDADGTISGKLRGIVKFLADILKIQGSVASGATDSGNPVKVGGKYNTTPPTLTNGQRGDLQLDVNANTKVTQATAIAGEDLTNNVLGTFPKPVASATYAPSLYTYWGAAITRAVIKASAGNVFSISVTNANAAKRYLLLHNKATAPAAAEAPLLSFVIPGGSADQPGVREIDLSQLAPSTYFSTGIGWSISTTPATFTDSATASEHQIECINYA